MSNPLDSFKSSTITTNDFRMPKMPSLFDLVKANQLMGGLAQFDSAMAVWSQQLERLINEKLEAKATTVSTSKL